MPDVRAVTARDGPVLGIDEAGRGAVIGPLVVAGVVLDEQAEEELEESGLRDSRRLTRPRRDRLAGEIRRLADPKVCVLVRSGREVDDAGNVHRLELKAAGEILTTMDWKRRAVADGLLFRPLEARYRHFKAVARGEEHRLAVAAASVIAKARGDELFDRIKRRYESECRRNQGWRLWEPVYRAVPACVPRSNRRAAPGDAPPLEMAGHRRTRRFRKCDLAPPR